MLQTRNIISALIISSVLMSGVAFAQDHNDQHGNQTYVRHTEWHKGAKINQDDWNRGEQVDWHAHHLQAPRSGYEWRQVDGNYVLAAADTGIILSTVIAAGH